VNTKNRWEFGRDASAGIVSHVSPIFQSAGITFFQRRMTTLSNSPALL
jgi:hypothetical protein